MIRRLSDNVVKVWCGKNGWYEVEKMEDGSYKVTDDDGNVIIIKKDELKLMGDAVNTLDGDDQLICGWSFFLYPYIIWTLFHIDVWGNINPSA